VQFKFLHGNDCEIFKDYIKYICVISLFFLEQGKKTDELQKMFIGCLLRACFIVKSVIKYLAVL